jgi:hypothetical protein
MKRIMILNGQYFMVVYYFSFLLLHPRQLFLGEVAAINEENMQEKGKNKGK